MSDFNPREHLIALKNRQGSSEYLPVQWRLVWFRQECPNGSIETEVLHLDLEREVEEESVVWNSEKRRSEKVVKVAKGLAIFKATVRDGKGGVATGTKMEKAASFADFLEKAETGAIGRALAALGYGTQFAPDISEGSHIVDAPVDQGNATPATQPAVPSPPHADPVKATDQQIASIRKLCQHLGKSEPENVLSMSSLAAKRLIQQLAAEYRDHRQAAATKSAS